MEWAGGVGGGDAHLGRLIRVIQVCCVIIALTSGLHRPLPPPSSLTLTLLLLFLFFPFIFLLQLSILCCLVHSPFFRVPRFLLLVSSWLLFLFLSHPTCPAISHPSLPHFVPFSHLFTSLLQCLSLCYPPQSLLPFLPLPFPLLHLLFVPVGASLLRGNNEEKQVFSLPIIIFYLKMHYPVLCCSEA